LLAVRQNQRHPFLVIVAFEEWAIDAFDFFSLLIANFTLLGPLIKALTALART